MEYGANVYLPLYLSHRSSARKRAITAESMHHGESEAHGYTPCLIRTPAWPFTYGVCLLCWSVRVGILHVRAEALKSGYFRDSDQHSYSRLQVGVG